MNLKMIPKGWRKYILGDLIEINKVALKRDFGFEKIEYIDTSSVTENRFSDVNIIPLKEAPSRAKRVVRAGDIIYSTVRPIQRHYGFLISPQKNTVVSTGFAVLSSLKIDARYLYFYLTQDVIIKYFDSIAEANTTTFPAFSPKLFETLEVVIPESITEQSRIATILSSLDDKIELNLRMNKTLEAIAQTIFKEWFVDFRFPGFDGELVDGLPKGWRKSKLGDIIDLKYGKALKSEKRISGIYPVVGSNGIVGFHNSPLVKSPGIVVSRKGTIGEVIWLNEDFYPIDTTYFVEDKVGVKDLYFHYYLLLGQDFKKIASDSAVPGLNKNQALMNPAILPDTNLMVDFSKLIKPLFEKKYLLEQEIKTLTLIRDSLLPKLMTGKIRVA